MTVEMNSASLNPLVCAQPRDYFRRCARLRQELKDVLVGHLRCNHSLYFLSNTTHGILAFLTAMLTCEKVPVALYEHGFPYYAEMLPQLLQTKMVPSAENHASALVTHIDPVTGVEIDLGSLPHKNIALVDGAQSVGTPRQAALFTQAKLFVAPTHKHLGLVAGLGMFGILPGGLDPQVENAIRITLELAEAGTMNQNILETALVRAKVLPAEGIGNRAVVNIGSLLLERSAALGLRVVTTHFRPSHIVSFTSADGSPVDSLLDIGLLTGKFFKRHNVYRLSIHEKTFPVMDPDVAEKRIARMLERASIQRIRPLRLPTD